MKPIFGFPVVTGGSDLAKTSNKISAIKFNDWSQWVTSLGRRCPTCNADHCMGIIWNGNKFVVCPTCEGRGFFTVE